MNNVKGPILHPQAISHSEPAALYQPQYQKSIYDWSMNGPVFVHQIPELLSPQKSPADSKLLEALPVR
ncbi:hypothetical protein T4E_11578 [Trichinella pseudospiralis]|uniref:Uncharacterized protein n=1 Tax=Trichinella pseudospiralis TaxID=6337 RepID=A0A0V1FNC4_TRIPS|nr:hypothetical protein T4E_11578 [Trichinella pseudospiralis]KRY87528.1 hypothetical protein T4D_9 [Trichinella pseudospiralis]